MSQQHETTADTPPVGKKASGCDHDWVFTDKYSDLAVGLPDGDTEYVDVSFTICTKCGEIRADVD